MSVRRFFVEPDVIKGDRALLTGDLSHHLCKVLRLSTGDEVLLLDGKGNHYLSRIEELSGSAGVARITEHWYAAENSLPVRLIQALPKGEKFDLILQKGCELGITRFSPVSSERSVPQVAGTRSEKKQQRWQRIVTEAARQSRRSVLPACDPIAPFGQVLTECQEELKLMLWEEESVPLSERLPSTAPAGVAVLVGPEGGFSAAEAAAAEAAGFLPVSLGPRILRTETSGFAVTAVLEYLYGDFG